MKENLVDRLLLRNEKYQKIEAVYEAITSVALIVLAMNVKSFIEGKTFNVIEALMGAIND